MPRVGRRTNALASSRSVRRAELAAAATWLRLCWLLLLAGPDNTTIRRGAWRRACLSSASGRLAVDRILLGGEGSPASAARAHAPARARLERQSRLPVADRVFDPRPGPLTGGTVEAGNGGSDPLEAALSHSSSPSRHDQGQLTHSLGPLPPSPLPPRTPSPPALIRSDTAQRPFACLAATSHSVASFSPSSSSASSSSPVVVHLPLETPRRPPLLSRGRPPVAAASPSPLLPLGPRIAPLSLASGLLSPPLSDELSKGNPPSPRPALPLRPSNPSSSTPHPHPAGHALRRRPLLPVHRERPRSGPPVGSLRRRLLLNLDLVAPLFALRRLADRPPQPLAVSAVVRARRVQRRCPPPGLCAQAERHQGCSADSAGVHQRAVSRLRSRP